MTRREPSGRWRRRGSEGRAEAAALALRAVAAVSLNDPATGAALADEAVALDPGLGAAHIARSYALQGQGRLDAARAAAEAAVEAAPDDAYAWARLAELELTIGNRRAAEKAVARSLEIAETALARSIEGFAALAANEFDAAEAAFQRAIAIDSEAPLPRLGLGLAAIRQGRVAEGRRCGRRAPPTGPSTIRRSCWVLAAILPCGRLPRCSTAATRPEPSGCWRRRRSRDGRRRRPWRSGRSRPCR